MILSSLIFLLAMEVNGDAPQAQTTIEKKIIYQKEQVVDLTGTTVEGENQLPPAFFVTKMQTPGAKSLLEERLRFGLRDYNQLGF